MLIFGYTVVATMSNNLPLRHDPRRLAAAERSWRFRRRVLHDRSMGLAPGQYPRLRFTVFGGVIPVSNACRFSAKDRHSLAM